MLQLYNSRLPTLPRIPARAKRTHRAARPGRHGVFCATQTIADIRRLSPAFSADLSWRAPCDTHCAAQCSAASGGDMWVLVNLAMLVMATVFAGAAAVAVYWLMLRATVELMRPAAVRTVTMRTELVRGTVELARAFDPRRHEE